MDSESGNHSPLDDSIVPDSPQQVYDALRWLRDALADDPQGTAVDGLNVALTKLEFAACPHMECPRMLLEHQQDAQEG